jgi:putative Mg2+ transporter-C (MgtC) family protein
MNGRSFCERDWPPCLALGSAGSARFLGAPVRSRAIALAAATAAMLVALTETYYPDETPRIVAGVVTGIGFLGAGAILRSSNGEVSGHTTAASMWAMSGIGMAVGSGHEVLGILLAFVLYTINAISQWPLLTRTTRYWAQKQAAAAGNPPLESQAPINPPPSQ